MSERKAEILSPAGTYSCVEAAVKAGADAVYAGGDRFGARAYAGNLSREEMLSAIDFLHIHGKKFYMTVNTLCKDQEICELYDYLLPYYERGLDGVIVQDPGVFAVIRRQFPDLPIHVSTQANITSPEGARLYESWGAKRIILARELSLTEIRQIREQTQLEIECFVHGALCYCYSGQCLLSSLIGGRSGNRGACAQPCRQPYRVGDGKEQPWLSLKDLCTIQMLPDLIEAGADALKIEGRMKQPEYVYVVTALYRKYRDLYDAKGRAGYAVSEADEQALTGAYTRRGYTSGYLTRHNGKSMLEQPAVERHRPASEPVAPSKDQKIPIQGTVTLSVGEKARLRLTSGATEVEVTGAVVEAAKRQPLSEETIRRQVTRTGETFFDLTDLTLQVEGDVFLPVGALNALRRAGLSALSDRLLAKRFRTAPERMRAWTQSDQEPPCDGPLLFSALVSDLAQLKVAISDEHLARIYVDDALAFSDEAQELLAGKREQVSVYLAAPYIFRMKERAAFSKQYARIVSDFDGVLIRNLDELAWLMEKGYPGDLVSDDRVYVWNQPGKAQLLSAGVSSFTAPVELNESELYRLGLHRASLIVYGYHPVMISAGCLRQNVAHCTGQEGWLFLTDRRQMKFPVKNCCRSCYNVIYNCKPLMLLDETAAIRRLSPAFLRLDFTRESEEKTAEILKQYEAAFLKGTSVSLPENTFTRGHFKRGV